MRALRLAGAFLLLAGAALADENADLDMIPGAVGDAPAPAEATPAAGGKLSLENAATATALRGGLVVPLPGATPPRWADRTSLDGRWQWELGHDVSVTFSDRVSVFAQGNQDFGARRTATNDLREAYATWEAAPRTYLEAGRINLRNGVALGYNPTDFFRAGTLLDQATADPSALRENRLGTAMMRAQHIAGWGTVSFAYAPKLYDPTRIGVGTDAPLDPHFDRTNDSERWLASVHADIGSLAPELLLFHQGERTRAGANISAPIGQQIVAYAEWSGGAAQDLIAEAVRYGIKSGTLPASIPVLPATGTASGFRQDFDGGFSWTGESKVTVNVEYILHQAALSRGEWRRWFQLGAASPNLAGEMWYLREYAAVQQVPMARQQMFLRADWPDGLARDIDLTALTFVSLDDGSAYAQIAATWNINRGWTAALYVGANLGPPRSDYGSLKTGISTTAQVIHYF
jgi:hypothetical protein